MNDRELMQQAFNAMLNFPSDISDEMFESIKSIKARLAQPEHTTPRQWQGLTDDELCELWESNTEQQPFPEWFVDFKRAYKVIEAKLKEKNT